ncbi:MAG: NAD(P)H-dependent oxidoreductase subunit E, partial [Spirosomataceae bacterium]
MTEIEEKVVLSPERLVKVQEIIKRYPEGQQKSALLPILHLVQEQFGW